MPTIHDLKQSRFLTKDDCGKGILLTIAGYHNENVARPGAEEEFKWVLEFEEDVKPLTLNTINGNTIAAITGREDFDGWIGTKIVAFNDPTVSFNGKFGGIRVRAPRNLAPAPSRPPTPPPAPKPAPRPRPRNRPQCPAVLPKKTPPRRATTFPFDRCEVCLRRRSELRWSYQHKKRVCFWCL